MGSFKDTLNNIDKEEVIPVSIITGIDNIKISCTEATMAEAEKIWPILEASLPSNIGHGLAAIQIGIPKKIAIIKYNNKIHRLLNTRLVEGENLITVWGEGCLSLPNKIVNTERFSKITIQDDMVGKAIIDTSDGLLPVIFQHEIDHFEGTTILDHQLKPIRKENKIGRNSLCLCGSGKKYKKCCLNADSR
jgi:peptide deformylase